LDERSDVDDKTGNKKRKPKAEKKARKGVSLDLVSKVLVLRTNLGRKRIQ